MARKICRLDEDTINRIAAGEIVQRPAAVVKELIENCLDAGSTTISVTCKGGGLDFLQIQDNGHGIPKESLGIVCERFTTSKISSFEDLGTVQTFGFRGEALASITHVAHVTITTMTADQKCAFKAKYLDGKLVPVKVGDKPEPKPCAGVTGTIIVVEDLFYNMTTRRQAFKSPQEEFQRILDVMTKHAVHFPHVSFVCKKGDKGVGFASLKTDANSSTLQNIKLIYGPEVARELLEVSASSVSSSSPPSSSHENKVQKEDIDLKIHGFISNANYSCKKNTGVVFINNRLVTCLAVQRCVDAVYKQYLPKHTHPFIYLAITMPPQHVDVNVHPTKKEVHFLFETELLTLLHEAMVSKLEGANDSRTFLTQSLLTAAASTSNSFLSQTNNNLRDNGTGVKSLASLDSKTDYKNKVTTAKDENDTALSTTGTKRSSSSNNNVAAHKFVRTDPSLQTIDTFFAKKKSSSSTTNPDNNLLTGSGTQACDFNGERLMYCMLCSTSKSGKSALTEQQTCDCCNSRLTCGSALPYQRNQESNTALYSNEVSCEGIAIAKQTPFQLTTYDYSSIRSLLKQIDDENDISLQSLLRRHTFVGVVDDVFLVVQSGTQLVLVDHSVLTFHLFRQLSIKRFGVMPPLILSQPVDVKMYIMHALETEDDTARRAKEENLAVTTALCNLLKSKSDMLREYFQIGFASDLGLLFLVSMPDLLSGYCPVPEALPLFLLRLGVEVDWEDEYNCFDSVSKELALCYSALPSSASCPSTQDDECSSPQPNVEKGDAISITVQQENENDVNVCCDDNGKVINNKAQKSINSLSPAAQSVIINVILPAIKSYVSPPKELLKDGSFIVIAALEQLYKVFERC